MQNLSWRYEVREAVECALAKDCDFWTNFDFADGV